MANSTTLLKYSLKTNIVKSIYFEIISKVSRYYYTFGKSTAWPTITAINSNNETYIVSSETDPPAVPDTYPYELQTRANMVYAKYIDANDAAVVVERINWFSGATYDMYDDYSTDNVAPSGAVSIDTARFYVITDEFNVYKCLSNNGNGISFSKPIGTKTLAFTLEDGYVWKFMYTIPLYLRNKFLSANYMPVVTALDNQFYSKGSIISYSIENRGYGYVANTWKVKRIIVVNGGKGYTTSTPFTFPAAPNGGTQATASITEVGSTGNVISISVTNQGSLYTTQPVATVAAPALASGLDWIIEYESASSAYTKLLVSGDGYNEYNPYSLKTVNIINRGSFVSAPGGSLFTFPSPQLAYGKFPEVSVTFRIKSGTALYEVDTITVTDSGYGYTSPLVFNDNTFALSLTTGGFTCDLNTSSQKNEAELIPLLSASGEIKAIQVVNPGIGYTYATVTVVGKKTVYMVPGDAASANVVDISASNTTGFVKASVLLNFGIGTIDSKQSNVELLAVDGSIEVVKVDNPGFGYTSNTALTISGDGVGLACQPVIANGQLVNVIVTNPGSGYTYASITANIGSNASLRAIISPKGGHGKDTVSELYAKTLMLYTRLIDEKNKNITITNDFRQIGILKNPKIYAQDTFYRKATGSTCVLLTCEVISSNTTAYNLMPIDSNLFLTSDSSKTFTIVEKSYVNGKYYLVVTVNNNFIPSQGNSVAISVSNITYPMSISSVANPDINKYSGELLYIDNRVKFVSSADQTVAVSTLITF
jgi:hypothetical protein